jgi:hypothetical protein
LHSRAAAEPLIRWGWLLAAGLLLQGTAALVVVRGLGDVPRAALIAASYAVLVAGVAANLKYWGFRLLLVGLLLNAVVIGANGWRMPVDPIALARTGYHEQAALPSGTAMRAPKKAVVERSEMTLWPLADVIAVTPARRVISVGDIFAYTGTIVALAGVIRLWRRREAAIRLEAAEAGAGSATGAARWPGAAREGPGRG